MSIQILNNNNNLLMSLQLTNKNYKKNITFLKKKNRNSIQCNNCNLFGHKANICYNPIKSYGIISFKIDILDNEESYDNIIKKLSGENINLKKFKYSIKYLLVNRKHSINYINFIRGKYFFKKSLYSKEKENAELIKKQENDLILLFSLMTEEEKYNIISSESFNKLWIELWGSMNNHIKQSKLDYKKSSIKFNNLKITNKLTQLLLKTNHSKKLDWGFPKGKKDNLKENDIDCALREFNEETGINKNNIQIIKNLNTKTEDYIGSNKKKYCYTYYFAFFKNLNNKISISSNEIGNVKWATYSEAINLITDQGKYKYSISNRLKILKFINDKIKLLLK